ncbi:hypothetical protein [Alloalcanivorax xenomutans]|uniref:hypothetical protein n=1 Tax=Alloalcanivorax xenomutans TaxID=1094342 RepID=UPI0006D829C0|nr:hypothetical protein [Alloalcanivorax xenomutans]
MLQIRREQHLEGDTVRTLKPSEKLALQVLAASAVVVLGLWWLMPGAHWGVYAFVGVVGFAGAYSAALKDAANKKQIDHD